MAEYTLDELMELPAYVVNLLPERVSVSADERYMLVYREYDQGGYRGSYTNSIV